MEIIIFQLIQSKQIRLCTLPAWDATTRKLLLSFLDTDFLKIHKTRGIDIQQKPLAIHTVGVFASCGLQEKGQMLVSRRQMVVATYLQVST